PEFEKSTGDKVILRRDTAGALMKLILGGEPFDLALLTPEGIEKLADRFVRGPPTDIARVGIGVVVRQGTPLPDIGTVEAVKDALLKARSCAYIEPQRGC